MKSFGIGEMGVGKMGQIIGETGLCEMGVGERGTNRSSNFQDILVTIMLLYSAP